MRDYCSYSATVQTGKFLDGNEVIQVGIKTKRLRQLDKGEIKGEQLMLIL